MASFPPYRHLFVRLRHRTGRLARLSVTPERRQVSRPWQSEDRIGLGAQLGPSTSNNSNSSSRSPLKPTLFCLLVSGGALVWAAQQTNVDTDERMERLRKRWGSSFSDLVRFNVAGTGGIIDRDLITNRRNEVVERAQRFAARARTWPSETARRIGILVAEEYANLRESQRTCLALVLLQAGVFLAWRAPGLQSFMARNFLHHPAAAGKRPYTLLTSVFSHIVRAVFVLGGFVFHTN
jgi:rhomboid-like protein